MKFLEHKKKKKTPGMSDRMLDENREADGSFTVGDRET